MKPAGRVEARRAAGSETVGIVKRKLLSLRVGAIYMLYKEKNRLAPPFPRPIHGTAGVAGAS